LQLLSGGSGARTVVVVVGLIDRIKHKDERREDLETEEKKSGVGRV